MGIWVYILRSETAGRVYCGQTDNLIYRPRQHNDPGRQLTRTPKRFLGPWKPIWSRGAITEPMP
ncbi:MAG: GIY-YIG nuclease family protein [Syntrophaceae bacterium]|nr:GIY-YIG nuclease family protein [Syntrophaceae bacterium]